MAASAATRPITCRSPSASVTRENPQLIVDGINVKDDGFTERPPPILANAVRSMSMDWPGTRRMSPTNTGIVELAGAGVVCVADEMTTGGVVSPAWLVVETEGRDTEDRGMLDTTDGRVGATVGVEEPATIEEDAVPLATAAKTTVTV